MTRWEGLYAIVDLPHAHGLDPADLTRALLGDRRTGGTCGAAAIQLRAKSATTQQRIAWLRAMAAPCADAGVPLLVNDDVDALVPGVQGVHLGQDDPGADAIAELRTRAPGVAVGLSTHDLVQLRHALRQRPDYVAFGPVAPTRSKENPDPVVGLQGLTDAARVSGLPLVAIGGLDLARAKQTIAHGAAMVAVIGALCHATLEATTQSAMTLARALAEAAEPLEIDAVAQMIPVLEPSLLQELARWGDSLSVHMALELPARFAPKLVDGGATYRYCEVLDLLHALGKRPDETWDQWRARGHDEPGAVVQLRRPR